MKALSLAVLGAACLAASPLAARSDPGAPPQDRPSAGAGMRGAEDMVGLAGCVFSDQPDGTGQALSVKVAWSAGPDRYAQALATLGPWWRGRIASARCDRFNVDFGAGSHLVRCEAELFADENFGGRMEKVLPGYQNHTDAERAQRVEEARRRPPPTSFVPLPDPNGRLIDTAQANRVAQLPGQVSSLRVSCLWSRPWSD